MLTPFAKDRNGVAAVLFALMAVPVFLFIALAVDYNTHSASKTKIQSVVDSAVLAAARVSVPSGATLPTSEQIAVYNATITSKLAGMPVFKKTGATLTAGVDKSLIGSIQGTSTLWFGAFIGKDTSTIDVTASVAIAGMDIEIAMGIDVSGSMLAPDMAGTRIEAAKAAANAMIDSVTSNASPAASIKFAYVPFAFTANIGTANTAYVTGASDPLFTGTSWAGCVFERPVPEHITNSYDGNASSPKGQWAAYTAPPEPNSPAGACANPSNGTNSGYEVIDPYVPGNFFPGTRGPNFNCVRHPMKPLTSTISDVKNGINSLTAEFNNGTVFSLGITWALRMLTPNAPFPGAAAFGPKTKKIIIALTDGAQTTEGVYQNFRNTCPAAVNSSQSYSFVPASKKLSGSALNKGPMDNISPYGYIYDSDPFKFGYGMFEDVDPSLDKLTLSACDYAKQFQNIEVYTIAVSSAAGPGTSIYNTLLACATDAKHFFWVTDTAGINEAFNAIAKNVKSLSLTR